MTTKPKLIFPKLPWQVCPSAPFLELFAAEANASAHLTFVAHFGRQFGDDHERGELPVEAQAPTTFQNNESVPHATYHRVRLNFHGCVMASLCEAHSDGEVIPEDEFDWSEIPIASEFTSPDDYFEQFHDFWELNGICPDPGFYEIRPSGSRVSQYLICGHDSYAKIFAQSWDWELGQAVWD